MSRLKCPYLSTCFELINRETKSLGSDFGESRRYNFPKTAGFFCARMGGSGQAHISLRLAIP